MADQTQQKNSAEPEVVRVYATAAEANNFARRLLEANGVPPDDAAIIASCLVQADLRGVDTHGLLRLPGYLERVRHGLINPRPSLSPQRTTPVAATLDGQNGFGFVIATRAMTEAIAMAREFGIGIVSVHQSTHFGMAATYLMQAVDAGMMSMVFTNAGRSMPPWGGREGIFGTNPFAAGVPGGPHGRPFLLDMSPAVAARGKIRRAQRRGESIPVGYALDPEGRPTTDPATALKGVVLPIGGPKGSGLAMLMDIFGGLISGAGYAGGVGDQYTNFDRPQNVGHFFLAMKPDLFISEKEFRARMDVLYERVKNCPKAEGFDEIYFPGELEARQEEMRRQTGIPYSKGEVGLLQEEANRVGIAGLAVSERPLSA